MEGADFPPPGSPFVFLDSYLQRSPLPVLLWRARRRRHPSLARGAFCKVSWFRTVDPFFPPPVLARRTAATRYPAVLRGTLLYGHEDPIYRLLVLRALAIAGLDPPGPGYRARHPDRWITFLFSYVLEEFYTFSGAQRFMPGVPETRSPSDRLLLFQHFFATPFVLLSVPGRC